MASSVSRLFDEFRMQDRGESEFIKSVWEKKHVHKTIFLSSDAPSEVENPGKLYKKPVFVASSFVARGIRIITKND